MKARICTMLLILAACGGGDGGNEGNGGDDGDYEIVDGNGRPIADAGPDQEGLVGKAVALNGSASRDREGTPLSFDWSFTEVPVGSTIGLVGRSTVNPTFVPDVHGRYVVRLVVSDGVLASEPDSVAIDVKPLPPEVDAGADRTVVVGAAVRLDGSESRDPAGEELTFAWRFVATPEGSTATLEAADTARPTFVPDRAGIYRIELRAETAAGSSATDEVQVESYARGTEGRVTPLAWKVVDAEYDRAGDRVIAVSAEPSALRILDPATLEEASVALDFAPLAVSVSPDGSRAVVGHDGRISVVALSPPAVEKTIEVATRADEVVLGGDWAWVFPGLDQPEAIYAIELATGNVTTVTGSGIHDGTKARLHPDGTRIYGADNGLSPSDVHRFDVSGGQIAWAWDSPYHGDYPMCGDLWIFETGERILTACGTVLRAAATQEEDLTYVASATSRPIVHADDSAAAGLLAALRRRGDRPGDPSVEVRLYDRTTLERTEDLELPDFPGLDRSWESRGRFVFFDAAGTAVTALVDADDDADVAEVSGIVRFRLDP